MIKKIEYIKIFISSDHTVFIPYKYDKSGDFYNFYMLQFTSDGNLNFSGVRTGRIPKEDTKGFINISFDLAFDLSKGGINPSWIYEFKDSFLYKLK